MSRPNVTVRAFVEYEKKFFIVYAAWCERWTLPGGRPEGAEQVEETLRRELDEELGVTPTSIRFVGFGQGAQYGKEIKCAPPKIHLLYHVVADKEPTLKDPENEKGKLVTLEELKRMTDKEDGIEDFFRRFPDAL